MRVAVTGASGFTGQFVANALAARGWECVPLLADLTDVEAVEQEISNVSFDRLIHLAARAFVDTADWRAFYAVNELGTFNLLDAIAKVRPGTRCILASSAQVYGPGAEGLVSEDAPTRPANHYAVSKLSMEQGASLWNSSLDLVVTRPFNYSGVGQDAAYLIPKIVRHFQCETPTIELGNLYVKRDFGDVRSVADAYAGLVVARDPPRLVNICTGAVHGIEDILAELTRISGHKIEVRVNPKFVRPNDVPVLGGDPTQLRSALPNWIPRELCSTLEWMYENAA